MLVVFAAGILLVLLSGCSQSSPCREVREDLLIERPNVVMILTEDIGPMLSCFGDSTVATPHLDQLAKEGVRFTRVYSTSGVCAPSRSALITGMYPASVGSNHMRTRIGSNNPDLPLDEYEVVMPEPVRCFTEYLRAAGYYCTIRGKRDWQFGKPLSSFNDYGKEGSRWSNRSEGQSFFSWINIFTTHESQVWERKGEPLHCSPAKVIVPPYYPDTRVVRQDIARGYSNVAVMDSLVGCIMDELRSDHLDDSTIVIFLSDHGGPLPRQKREIINSGLHVPMIIRFPGGYRAGEVDSSLISFVDLAPTILGWTGVEAPSYLHGRDFSRGGNRTGREYVFGARDRIDSQYDRSRSVCDGRFVYVRNYFPCRPWKQDIEYRRNMDMIRHMNALHAAGELDSVVSTWFMDHKAPEFLFDLENDPWEIHNLAGEAGYREKLVAMRRALEDWKNRYGDKGTIPEADLVAAMWPGYEQPLTADPVIRTSKGKITLHCSTPGSSLVYCFADPGIRPDPGEPNQWKLYTEPLVPRTGKHLFVVANRIGYANSNMVVAGDTAYCQYHKKQ